MQYNIQKPLRDAPITSYKYNQSYWLANNSILQAPKGVALVNEATARIMRSQIQIPAEPKTVR